MEKRKLNYNNQILGKIGEQKAYEYLKEIGYYILQRNFRCRMGEIDIIAKDKNKELVFIEVKTRRSYKYGTPAEAVNFIKKRHIYKVASYYMLANHIKNQALRFDIIEIFVKDKYYIHHIKQAF